MINAIKLENSNNKLSRLAYLKIIIITLFSMGILGCGGKPADRGNSGFPKPEVNFFSSQTR